MNLVNFVGYSGSGKTTLIEQLIQIFSRAGLDVAAIKNSHHDIELDKQGKDSYRFRKAGARQVLLHSGKRWALMVDTPGGDACLQDLLKHINSNDLTIVEGFKSESIDALRLEVWRKGVRCEEPICIDDKSISCVVTDEPSRFGDKQTLDINNPKEVAYWVARKLKLNLDVKSC